MKHTICILGISLALLFTACSKSAGQEEVSINAAGEITSDENMLDGNMEMNDSDDAATGYEGEWYRTGVASYQWARIVISDWKEGESFDVTLDVTYTLYSGVAEGTATFIEEDTAVLYDGNKDGGHGIYFHFLEDSIEVTHDADVRAWFGGGGISTAAGTYIQGEVEYTNCTDVSEIFTENELEQIQELLGERYDPLFKNLIEFGEIKEYPFDKVCMWMAYRPNSSERCYITIYEDGRIYIEYIEKCSDPDGEKVFYTNSENAEMPDDELLSVEWEEIKALDIPEDMLAYWMVINSKMPFISYDEGNQEFYWDEYSWRHGTPCVDDRERFADYDEFVVVDLNNDGRNELILYYGMGMTEVFHYEDNAVYGFQSVLRHMGSVYTNGIYMGSDSADHGYYSRLTELDKDGYTEETAAEAEYSYVGDSDYEIGGISVSQEEYEEFAQNIEETGQAEDIPYVGLDACLLGGLSEDELYMVKHVEVLPMTDTPSYPMEPEIRQAYYDVLTGGKELISVTDDRQRFYLDDYQQQNGMGILYFSIVDMDQDGIYEVVLSCSHDTTQILHYADGEVYSYQYDSDYGRYGNVIGAMSNQGIFEMGSIHEDYKTTYYYGKIVSFTEDGCSIQEVGQSDDWRGDWYDRINDDRIRYHYFSEGLIEQYFR